MSVRFIGSAPENFRAGRPAGFVPEAIILHRTGGTRESFRARFNDPAEATSAHSVVCRDGSVDQYVLESDTAFHAGHVAGATWPALRPNVNPNFYTIGIELEGAHGDDWPDAQIDAAATLIAHVARRWEIAIDERRVVPHRAIRPASNCPASTCPFGRLLELARGVVLPQRVPRETVVRILNRTNVREGAPTTRAPIARVMPPDTVVTVTSYTDAGEQIEGNACWYSTGEDEFFWAGATSLPDPRSDDGHGPLVTLETGTTDIMELSKMTAPPPAVRPGVALTVDRTTFVLPPKEFIGQETRKDLIVLHFTAGRTARSAFDTWRNDPRRIATAYIVDVDGTIYEVFPPKFWAAHLGVDGTKNLHDRRSIGIEIANVGPLQPSADDPETLNWWLPRARGAPEFTTRFCGLAETDKYVNADFRTKKHFASFPDAQVNAVAALVRGLCEEFGIPGTLPPAARRFDCDPTAFAGYKGVCSHANFRQDKWDIGPAFAWDRLGL